MIVQARDINSPSNQDYRLGAINLLYNRPTYCWFLIFFFTANFAILRFLVVNMFNDLYDAIKLQTDLFCDQVNINRVSNIGNIWVNVNEYGHSNQAHHHANCVLSGVFYAHTEYNEQAGSIVFKHPASDLMAYNWANIQKGEYIPENSLNWRFDCKPGDLIIFPSWLIHHVQPNLALNYKRISISFNLS